MFVETNKLGSRQKKIIWRGYGLYEVIRKQYIAIIHRNNNSTHSSEHNSALESTSDKENKNYLQLSCKRQKLTKSSKKTVPFVLHHKNANFTLDRQEVTGLHIAKHVPCKKYRKNSKCD